jgi:uncharacterized lipoprotein YddW (UPF0748 family)
MKFVFKTLLLFLFFFNLLFSQTKNPAKEVRAVWVATVTALDWPTTSGAENQKNETIRILDDLKSNNFNTVVLQVRSRGDLLYPSAIEPWAKALTGTLGRDPGYDPLQFWIDETHKRGMELHAWWNFSNTASETTPPPSVGLPHIAQTHPEWVKVAGTGGMYMDVGYPEAREYLINTAMEMVRGYDIDAIHFDYIRYLENIPNSWDSSAYRQYGGGMGLADWRRENINKFVRAIYDSIKAIKPRVKVGSTPVGNYDPVQGVGAALYGYSAVYCDSRRWLREGKHDYLAPQIYWALTGSYPFDKILDDWMKNSYGRHIWAGVASYQDQATNPSYSQTANIIQVSRNYKSVGNIFFRLRQYITRNNYESTKSSYQYPANIPAMPWIDNIPPGAPQNLRLTRVVTGNDTTWRLSWTKPAAGLDGDTAKYYNIYRSPWTVLDYEDGANLYHITNNTETTFTVTFAEPLTRNYYFWVSALDRNHVESTLSNRVTLNVTTDVDDLEKPVTFKLEQNYPNPFNPTTTIPYHISSRGNVRLSVYNVLGQEVKVLVDEVKDAGDYLVKFDASNLSTGVYLYRLDVSSDNKVFVDYKKMLLTK